MTVVVLARAATTPSAAAQVASPTQAASPAPAAPTTTASASAKPEAVKPSTPTVSSIYDADKLRDPFQELSGGGSASSGHSFSSEEFSIHNLSLKGIMRDQRSDFALFSDNTWGYSFILRRGRLYDPKGKPVPGVAGRLNIRQKTASLQTSDSDVQVFRLGEESKD